MAFDVFDTDSVATAGITFSNGNLTALGATGTSLFSQSIAQAIEGKTSGKWYVEFTCVAASGNVDGCGVLSSWGLGSSFLGNTNGGNSPDMGWGYYTNSNVVHLGGAVSHVNGATYGAGDVIGLAIDLTNQRIWFRKNTGSWQGTTGTPDPATNTAGFDISTAMTGGARIFPAAALSGNTAQYTANFGASAFTGTVPSGFTSGWTNTTAGTYFGTFATSGQGSAVTAPTADQKAVSKYTATLTGNVASITVAVGTRGGNVKGVIYDATGTGGLPGALLGVSSNVVSSGNELTFTFSGVSVTSGTAYWFGIVGDGSTVTLCPVLTNGIAKNSGTYASPTNPFGASPTTQNFRIPLIVTVTGNTDTGTAVMSFAGIGFTATAADRHTSTATLAFSGVSFVGAASDSGARTTLAFSGIGFSIAATDSHTAAATMAFSGIAFSTASTSSTVAAGVLTFSGIAFAGAMTAARTATGVLSFGGISIDAATLDFPSPGAGRRSFWTFGA